MKRAISLFLVLLITFSLTACKKSANEPTATPTIESTTNESISGDQTDPPAPTNPTTDETQQTDDVQEPSTTTPIETTPSPDTDEPIEEEPEDVLLTFMIEGHEFHLEMPLSSLTENFASDYNPKDVLKPQETRSVCITTNSGKVFVIEVYNESHEPIIIDDCSIWSIEIKRKQEIDFSFRPTTDQIDFHSTRDDVFDIFGNSFMSQQEGSMEAHLWLWEKSQDQGTISIGIAFEEDSGVIEYIYLARETFAFSLQ